MNFWYATTKLKKQLPDEKRMLKDFGKKVTRGLKRRLDFLVQAKSLADVPHVPPLRRHEYSGDKAGHFTVDLTETKRLEFIPYHDPVPLKDDGGISLEDVTDIEFLGVNDPH